MRPILFQIPLDRPWHLGPLGDVPGFGFGLVLLVWTLYFAWATIRRVRKGELQLQSKHFGASLLSWGIGSLIIVFGAPALGAYLRNNGTDNWKDGLPVFGYGLMMCIGFATAIFMAERRALGQKLPGELIWDMATWLIIPGLVGARLFYLIQYGDRVFRGVPLLQWPYYALNFSQGGIVLYGALLGGAIGYFSFCYFRRIRPLGLADIIVPSVFIGIGFGRIGCFLYGCCYGRETNLPWAVQFPADSSSFISMMEKHLLPLNATCTPPLHPTQIYSSIDGFMIAALTSWYYSRRRRNGEVLALALIIYPITRFCVELLRADEGGQLQTSLTISQLISIGLFLLNIPYMVYLSSLPARRDPIVLPPRAATGNVARTASS